MKSLRFGFPLVALLLLSTPFLKADSNVRIVSLSFVQGDVLIDQGTGQGFKHAVMNMPVTSSTRLRTGDDGLVEVQFEDGSTLRLIGNTSVLFQPLALTDKGMRVSGMTVPEGTVYVHVLDTKHDRFLLKAQDLELDLTKGTHLRISADNMQTLVAVFHGDLLDPGTGLDVGKNQSLRIDNKANTISDVAKGIDPFATDAWDSEREKYHQNPSLYPSLATSSVAYAPASAPMIGCSYGMMLGSFGVYSSSCLGMGFSGFNPLYANMWFPMGLNPMMFGYDGFGYDSPLAYGYAPYGYGYGVTPAGVAAASGLRNVPKPTPTHTTRPMQAASALPRTAVSLPTVASSSAGARGVHTSFAPINRGAMASGGYAMGGAATTAARWRPFTPSRAASSSGMRTGFGPPSAAGGYGYAGPASSMPAARPSASAPAGHVGGSPPAASAGRPGR